MARMEVLKRRFDLLEEHEVIEEKDNTIEFNPLVPISPLKYFQIE